MVLETHGHSTLRPGGSPWNAGRMEITARRFERILLATDGSEVSKAAVDATIAIAKSPTAKVRVAHVWNLAVRHRHGLWDVEVRSEAGKLVDATVERLFRAGGIAGREICRADSQHVAAAIACAAKAFGADLVVVGSQGLSDWRSLTRRSDSNQMLCGLVCPVLIVRAAASGSSARRSKVLLAMAAGDNLEPGGRAVVSAGPPRAVCEGRPRRPGDGRAPWLCLSGIRR